MAKRPLDQVSNLRQMAVASTAALGLPKSQEQTTTINARLALAWVNGNLRRSIAVAGRAMSHMLESRALLASREPPEPNLRP